MRKLIAGMKLSLDGKVEGAEGTADWVASVEPRPGGRILLIYAASPAD